MVFVSGRCVLALAFLVGSTCGCATEPRAELQGAEPIVAEPWGADLAPMAPDWNQDRNRNYATLVRRVLLPEDEPKVWMVCKPSFHRESALALEPVDGELDEDGRPVGPPRTWMLTVTSSWIARVERGEVRQNLDWAHADRGEFDVSTASVEIDAEIAVDIYEAWKWITRRARQPEPEYVFDSHGQRVEVTRVIFDGVRYEFGCAGFYGETHSPRSGPARDLAEIAMRLAEIPTLQGAQRDAALDACAQDARRLRERAESLPW